jgi:ABC-type uncharacterized transport system ATPase subunit
MADNSTAVRVRGLVKSYGPVQAVRGIDLDIHPGEIFALLGPNGAGKTTTVEILEGYRRRDSGEVLVLGHDPGRERAKIKPLVGIVLQKTGVDRYLPADRLADIAQQLQEWELEELAAAGRPATWPECPKHPDSHPLSPRVRDGVAVWSCPRTGRTEYAIGGVTTIR